MMITHSTHKYLLLASLLLFLAACGNEEDEAMQKAFKPMNEFEEKGGYGVVHFVYIEPNLVGKGVHQREMARDLCNKSKHFKECEIYMWDNKYAVPTSFPFKYNLNKNLRIDRSLSNTAERGYYKRNYKGEETFQTLGRDSRTMEKATKRDGTWSKDFKDKENQQ